MAIIHHILALPLAQRSKPLKPKTPLLGLCWMAAEWQKNHFIMPGPKTRRSRREKVLVNSSFQIKSLKMESAGYTGTEHTSLTVKSSKSGRKDGATTFWSTVISGDQERTSVCAPDKQQPFPPSHTMWLFLDAAEPASIVPSGHSLSLFFPAEHWPFRAHLSSEFCQMLSNYGFNA